MNTDFNTKPRFLTLASGEEGVVVADLNQSVLRVSYSGPYLFDDDLSLLLKTVGDVLTEARRARYVVDAVSLYCSFSETEAEQEVA